MSPKASRAERKVIINQTQYFKSNRTIKICIEMCFLGMLNKVNRWLTLKAKLQIAIQTQTKGFGIQADHDPS